MNEQELREVLVRALQEIAPEVDPAAIDPDASLTEQLELDSMDLLNVVVSVHEQTGIEIPERILRSRPRRNANARNSRAERTT